MKHKARLFALFCFFTLFLGAIKLNAQAPISEGPQPPALALSSGWKKLADSTKNSTVRDMAIILKGANAVANFDRSQKDIIIYEKIKYLMPLTEALKEFPLKGKVKIKTPCSNPAFPSHSFYINSYDIQPIKIPWRYNTCEFMSSPAYEQYICARKVSLEKTDKIVDYLRINLKAAPESHEFSNLHIISDAKDQIVGIGFSCNPAQPSCFMGSTFWHTFDFMNMREKAITTAGIRHDYFQKNQVIQIYSQFGKEVYDWMIPKRSLILGKDDALLCWSQYLCVFFIPKPIADIILLKIN